MPLHHHIDIEVRSPYRRRADVALLRAAAQCTFAARRLRAPRGVSITVTDTRTVRRLNRDFLGRDEPTDVLAFITDFPRLRRPDGVRELGALVIALPVAARGARERGVVLPDELALLVVHGTLHLLASIIRRGATTPPCAAWSASRLSAWDARRRPAPPPAERDCAPICCRTPVRMRRRSSVY